MKRKNPIIMRGPFGAERPYETPSLTLRDLFAAAAIRGAALLTIPMADEIARDAYALADAMLRERAKEKP